MTTAINVNRVCLPPRLSGIVTGTWAYMFDTAMGAMESCANTGQLPNTLSGGSE